VGNSSVSSETNYQIERSGEHIVTSRNQHVSSILRQTGLDKQRNKVTTVSVYRNGESKTFVRGQDLTAENLRKEFSQSKCNRFFQRQNV